MSSFPLLRLPLLCQLDVINRMRISEIIALSYCSKRSLGLIRNVNIEMEDMRISKSYDCENNVTIALKPRDQDQDDYVIHLEPPAELERKHRRLISERAHLRARRYSYLIKNVVNERRRYKIRHRVTALRLCHLRQRTRLAAKRQHAEKVWKWSSGDGLEWVHRRDIPQTGHLVFHPDGRFFDACDVFFKHLMTLFRRFGAIHVLIHLSLYSPNWALRKHIAKKVHSFFIGWEMPILSDMIDDVFEDSLPKTAFIYGKCDHRFLYFKGFEKENVIITNAHWVTFSTIWNSTSKTINLNGCRLPNADKLKGMLEEWQAVRRFENLERLTLVFNEKITERYRSEVFKNVKHLPFTPPKEDWEPRKLEKWTASACDVHRLDGKVASVLLVDKTFEFRVRDDMGPPRLCSRRL